MNFAAILNAVNTTVHAQHENNFREAYKKYTNKKDANDLLNELHNQGYWVDTKGLEQIFKEGKLPDKFISAGETHTDIASDSLDYKKASDIVNEYFRFKDIKQEAEEPIVQAPVAQIPEVQTAKGTIHIIRHGKTIEDEKGINSGPTQEPITAEGKKEVEEGALGKVTAFLRKIITSGRQRAIESAEVIGKDKNISIEQNTALDPWNTGDEKTGFAEIKDEEWKIISDWFALHPDERVYTGDNEELKKEFADRSLTETFNEFKQRVLSAMPEITNSLSDGGAIMTHSNVIQLLKAYVANGSRNDGNIGTLYVQNEPSKNGEFIEFQRQQINPNFSEAEAIQNKEGKMSQEEVLALLEGRLIKVTKIDALNALEGEVASEILSGEYTGDGVDELFNIRREEISKNVNIRDIKEGQIILLKTGEYVTTVKLIKRGTYSGKKATVSNPLLEAKGYTNDLPTVYYLTKDNIKLIKGMEPVKTNLTDKEKSLAKDNQEKNTNFMADVAVKTKLQAEVKKEGTQKGDEDFFNDLGCK